MLPKLEGYAAALLGSLDSTVLATVASDFAAHERTILANPELHATLTDTAVTPVARGQVLNDLLKGKLHDVSVRLAVYAATEVPAQQVPHEIAEVAASVHRYQETGERTFANLGLLASRERISGYADALVDEITTDNFTKIEEDLFRWAHFIRNRDELRRFLTDRDAPVSERLALTNDLLEGKVDPIALTLARFVIEGGRPRDVAGSVDYLVDYLAQARNWRIARIHTARPLDVSSRAELADSLASLTGKSIELQIANDPELLGGLLIEVGDLRLDATTRGRLGALHDAVASGRLYESALNRND